MHYGAEGAKYSWDSSSAWLPSHRLSCKCVAGRVISTSMVLCEFNYYGTNFQMQCQQNGAKRGLAVRAVHHPPVPNDTSIIARPPFDRLNRGKMTIWS
jgi:hypothetical protein